VSAAIEKEDRRSRRKKEERNVSVLFLIIGMEKVNEN
jgi:hypothetical protein